MLQKDGANIILLLPTGVLAYALIKNGHQYESHSTIISEFGVWKNRESICASSDHCPGNTGSS